MNVIESYRNYIDKLLEPGVMKTILVDDHTVRIHTHMHMHIFVVAA